jgi:5-oxoprolinase (ATP-hydrolysing)
LLSVDPQNYRDAPTEAIRRVLQNVEGRDIPVGEKLKASSIGKYFSFGTDDRKQY